LFVPYGPQQIAGVVIAQVMSLVLDETLGVPGVLDETMGQGDLLARLGMTPDESHPAGSPPLQSCDVLGWDPKEVEQDVDRNLPGDVADHVEVLPGAQGGQLGCDHRADHGTELSDPRSGEGGTEEPTMDLVIGWVIVDEQGRDPYPATLDDRLSLVTPWPKGLRRHRRREAVRVTEDVTDGVVPGDDPGVEGLVVKDRDLGAGVSEHRVWIAEERLVEGIEAGNRAHHSI
jgi:hypothetical protein